LYRWRCPRGLGGHRTSAPAGRDGPQACADGVADPRGSASLSGGASRYAVRRTMARDRRTDVLAMVARCEKPQVNRFCPGRDGLLRLDMWSRSAREISRSYSSWGSPLQGASGASPRAARSAPLRPTRRRRLSRRLAGICVRAPLVRSEEAGRPQPLSNARSARRHCSSHRGVRGRALLT